MKTTTILRLATTAIAFIFAFNLSAQTPWYNAAQSRIDTLRKGTFAVKVMDKQGNPVTDSVKIVHKKHDFAWGYAIDLYPPSTAGTTNKGSTSNAITSVHGDNAIYQ